MTPFVTSLCRCLHLRHYQSLPRLSNKVKNVSRNPAVEAVILDDKGLRLASQGASLRAHRCGRSRAFTGRAACSGGPGAARRMTRPVPYLRYWSFAMRKPETKRPPHLRKLRDSFAASRKRRRADALGTLGHDMIDWLKCASSSAGATASPKTARANTCARSRTRRGTGGDVWLAPLASARPRRREDPISLLRQLIGSVCAAKELEGGRGSGSGYLKLLLLLFDEHTNF